MIRDLAGRTWVHIACGALLMGAWAAFANRIHAGPQMLQAAVIQGLLSGALTAMLKTVADHLRSHLPHWTLAAGVTFLLSAALLLKVHTMAGTPELGATVAVPLTVSGLYVFTYSYLRGRDA